MRKLVSLSLALVALLLVSTANAEVVSGTITTASAGGWTVGYLGTSFTVADEVTFDYGTKGQVAAVHWNDNKGYNTTQGGWGGTSHTPTNSTTIAPDIWAGSGTWVAVPEGTFQSDYNSSGVTSYVGKGDTGFYGFSYAFNVDLDGAGELEWFNFGGNVNVDNKLVGVYLNGILVDDSNVEFYTSNQGTVGAVTVPLSFSFEIDPADISASNVLTFVVQSYDTSNGSNPVGLNLVGKYDYAPYPHDDDYTPTTTPEPATMLIIGLGIAGLGLARRRNRK
jgi:hypothetical protein